MSPSFLSSAARSFLDRHIHTVMQLELLLLLYRNPEASWTAATVAQELRIEQGWTAGQLVDFGALGLLTVTQGSPSAYRFASDAPDAAVVAELASAYDVRKPSVIRAIFTPAGRDAQAFSDAFRLRGDDD
jgi:hypothetical protein